ncbi:MAG: hypothetical protein HPY75_03205 [Actinobacteria bacterium]|nr:hypothetical protein [Actinomycetota bacterium]
MRRVIPIFAASVAALLVFVPFALAQGTSAQIEEVFAQTEAIRRLQASPDIKVNFLSREQLEERMIEDFEKDNPEEEMKDAEEIMELLGFIDPDLDLKDFYIDLLTEQVAGFYDPEDDGLYLISEERESMSVMDRYTLAHEFVHYLQDANFDLMRPPFHDPEGAEAETDDDASFAATCLVEGDAMIASEFWLTEYVDVSEMLEMQLESGDYSSEVLDSAPDYIRDGLLFPYTEGAEFVRYIHKRGGFAAVDAAFSDPPTTTEQIYHPEKYVEGEGAVAVDLEDLSDTLGEGFELDYENVLGEFDVYELFKPYMREKAATRAAEGWGGNNYHYYSNGGGGKLLVQEYAWDSEKDAQEFASAYLVYVEGLFGDEARKGDSTGAWTTWRTRDYFIGMKLDGDRTWLVQSTEDMPFQKTIAFLGGEGDAIEGGALEDEGSGSGAETDLTWLVVALVVGLLVLGLALVVTMLVMYRKPPRPPAPPSGISRGPYYYPPPPPPPSNVPPPPGMPPTPPT